MSTGYGWESIRQVCATLLGARHVPERLCGGSVYTWGAKTSARPFSVVVSALALFNVVNQHRARLLLGWVTADR